MSLDNIHALIAEGITLTSVEGLTNWLLEEMARKCIEALAQHSEISRTPTPFVD
jgi:predicted GTPase